LEVLAALAGDLGVQWDHLEKLRAAMAFEQGAFAERIVWSSNAPANAPADGAAGECSAGTA
jgi:hypothetical protein